MNLKKNLASTNCVPNGDRVRKEKSKGRLIFKVHTFCLVNKEKAGLHISSRIGKREWSGNRTFFPVNFHGNLRFVKI